MVKDEEMKTDEEQPVGLVTLTGEIGLGMKMPNGDVIQLKNIDVGHAQVLGYLVTTVSEIKKELG